MKELLFFNNKGEQLYLSTTDKKDYYSGTIFLESSSVGLVASESLHIVEKIGENFGYPKSKEDIEVGTEFSAIKFYDVKENSVVELSESKTLSPVESFPSTSLRINYLIEGKEAGVYTDYIFIKIDDILISLTVHAEFVGEDDRLVDLLSNIGEDIGEEEYKILRDTDITGAGIDFKKLNAKRKEFLLEAHNIKPFIGSYKGVLNILKFFGYSDLRVKEYFKNIKTGVGSYEPVDSYEKHGNNIINGVLQKTSMFGLFYDITVPDGFDEFGTEKRKKNFSFSNDEIVIKLFALQRYIKNKGIGGASKLIDIIGEHYFSCTNLVSTWVDKTRSCVIDEGEDVKMEILSGKVGYIKDLRNDLLKYSYGEDRDLSTGFNPRSHTALGHFSHLNLNSWEVKEDKKVIIGHLLKVSHTTFDKDWTVFDITWERFKGEDDITWDKMFISDYYEVKWTVLMQGGKTKTNFKYEEVQKIKTINTLELILPYSGTYSVKCEVFKYGGLILSKTDYVEVRVPEVDFYHAYKYVDPNLQRWQGMKNLSWKDLEGDFETVYNNSGVFEDIEKVTSYSFTLPPYLKSLIGEKRLEDSTTVSWKELGKSTWDQSTYLTWENCLFYTSTHQKIIIDSIELGGGYLMLSGYLIYVPKDITTLESLALYLREQGLEEAIRGQINYRKADQGHEFIDIIVTTHDNGKNGILWGSDFLGIISDKNRSSWEDYNIWDSWKIWENLSWNILFESCQPTARPGYFTDTNTILRQSSSVIPPFTNVFFTVDASSMVAPEYFKWELLIGDKVIATSDTELWSYSFITPAVYSVRCTIRDRNNNENIKMRENLIIVLSSEAFTQYLLENKNTQI